MVLVTLSLMGFIFGMHKRCSVGHVSQKIAVDVAAMHRQKANLIVGCFACCSQNWATTSPSAQNSEDTAA